MTPALCFALLLLLAPQDAAKKDKEVPPKIEGLELTIEFESTTVAPKTRITPKQVTLKYTGKEPISLVLPGDGSACNWRQPYVVWSLLEHPSAEHPAVPKRPGIARCGYMNALRLDEVFTLKKGQRKVLEEWVRPLEFEKPGQYRVQLVYINDPNRKDLRFDKGNHPVSPEIEAAFRKTTPVRVASNEVVFTVR